MKPHQTLDIIIFRMMKAQTETHSLTQSVFVKHSHPVPHIQYFTEFEGLRECLMMKHV